MKTFSSFDYGHERRRKEGQTGSMSRSGISSGNQGRSVSPAWVHVKRTENGIAQPWYKKLRERRMKH